MQTPTLYKKTAQALVSRSQNDSATDTRATMRAIESMAPDCYDFDSVDDTLDFCYQHDSNLFND